MYILDDQARGAPKRGALVRAMEQREAGRRVQEAARQELERFYASQPVLEHMEKSVVIDDVKRLDRQSRERGREAELLGSLAQAERAKALALLRAEEEERLADALAQRVREQTRRECEIQKLREESAELRGLAVKIRTAKVSREREAQLAEKAVIKQQQAEDKAAMERQMERVALEDDARRRERDVWRRDQAVKASRVQQEQMMERQAALRRNEEEHARERALVDEVVRLIQEEDLAEERLKRAKQAETKALIQRFMEQQSARRRASVLEEREEDRRLQHHWERLREREAEEAARKQEALRAADRLYEQVRRQIEAERRRLEEEQAQIDMLQREEVEQRRRREEEAQRLRAERMRQEIRQANEQQRAQREAREAAFVAEEEEFRRRLMAQFAEADRLEQMNQQRRRMKVLEHQKAVQAMIDDKRRAFLEARAREEAEVAAQRAEDERRLALVEDERRRLLAEVAELRDYLPPGVIRSQEDLDYINQIRRERGIRTEGHG